MAAATGISIQWTAPEGEGLATDMVYATAYNDTKKKTLAFGNIAVRSELLKLVDIEAELWDDLDKIYVYVSFKRADGLDVSNSQTIIIN